MSERASEVPTTDTYTNGDRHEQPELQSKVHRRGKEDPPLESIPEKSGDESTSEVVEVS